MNAIISKESTEFFRFSNWLKELFNDKVDFSHKYHMLKINKDFEFKKFSDAYKKYRWGKVCGYKASYLEFCNWRSRIKKGFEKGNDEELHQICCDVLEWGGLTNSNKNIIDALSHFGELLPYLLKVRKLISYIFNEDDQCQYTLDYISLYKMNSAFTKIYTCLDERFVMYDSRTAAGIGYLVQQYRSGSNLGKETDVLKFPYMHGRSKKNRDPNTKGEKFFPVIHYGEGKKHFIANINLSLLLNWIADDIHIEGADSRQEKLFALQSALFMIGYEIPN